MQACGDSARNVLCCPVSGVDAHEAFDARPVAEAVSDFFTGNREYANLPRKFKISVTGCVEDCAQAEINDIGLWPARADDGTLGFNLLVGGGLSDGERMASDIDVFVRQDQAVEITRAIAQLFGELGNRENRGLARMRYLVQELGPEGFREQLAARARFELVPAGEDLTRRYRGDHVGVHPQKEDGLFYVGCSVPVGRMNGLELVEAARLAETYGDGTVRIGTDQNITFTGVPEDRIDAMLAEDLLQKYSPYPGPFTRGVVACTGSEFCRYAIVETKERAVKWARFLDEQLAGEPVGAAPTPGGRSGPREDAGVIRMHFSGCSASCAQPQIADIGFRGEVAHVGNHLAEAVDIGMGGSLGADVRLHRLDRARPPGQRRARRPAAGGPPLPGGAAGGRAVLQLGPPDPQRRPPPHPGRGGHRHPGHAQHQAEGGRGVKAYRIREEMNGIAEPPGKTWFWELQAGVIDAGRCIQCGTCVAACPSNSIGIDEDTDLPELVKMCTGCSLCWDFCPRGGLRYEALWPPSTVDAEGVGRAVPRRRRRGAGRRLRQLLEDHRRPPRGRARRGARRPTRSGPAPGPTRPRTAGWSPPC